MGALSDLTKNIQNELQRKATNEAKMTQYPQTDRQTAGPHDKGQRPETNDQGSNKQSNKQKRANKQASIQVCKQPTSQPMLAKRPSNRDHYEEKTGNN